MRPGLITFCSSITYTSFLKIKKVLGLVVFSLDNVILFIFIVSLISEVLLGLCHIFLIKDCASELLCFVDSFPGKKHCFSPSGTLSKTKLFITMPRTKNPTADKKNVELCIHSGVQSGF